MIDKNMAERFRRNMPEKDSRIKGNKDFLGVYMVNQSYKARLDKLADEVWEYAFGMLIDPVEKDGLLILNKDDIVRKFGALDKLVIPENEYSEYYSPDLKIIAENIYRYLFGMIKDKTIGIGYAFKAKYLNDFELSMGIFRNESCWSLRNYKEVKEIINVYENKPKNELNTLKSFVIWRVLGDICISFIDGKDMHSLDNSDIVRRANYFSERELSREELLDLRIALELELKKFKLRVDKKGNGIEIRNWYS